MGFVLNSKVTWKPELTLVAVVTFESLEPREVNKKTLLQVLVTGLAFCDLWWVR